MTEDVTKALHDAMFLEDDLRAVYKGAIDKNDALVVLMQELLRDAVKIRQTLAQLEKC